MSCIGYYTTSYEKLVEVFGKSEGSNGYKVSTEWDLTTDDGLTFSLYDYKETSWYNGNLPSVKEFRSQSSYSWHICGFNSEDATRIILYLNKKLT